MTSLPLTKNNLKSFMQFYSQKMEGKQQTPSLKSGKSSRASSRSRSRGRGGKLKFKNKHTNRRTKSLTGKALRQTIAKTFTPIIESKRIQEKKLSLAKSGYFADSKDSKTDIPAMQSLYDSIVRELDMARNAMRAGLKDKPIRMKISAGFVITTTVTSGVTNTVNINASGNASLDPSKCTEWSALAGLFDEYKCLGGECEFLYHNPITAPTTGGAGVAVVSDNIPIMGYDVDQNTPSSSLSITQLSQHKSFSPQTLSNGNLTCPSEGTRHKFRWHVPRGTAIYGSANTLAPGTEWVATAGVVAAGYIVYYHLGSVNTATNTGAGWIYFDLEFRCRA